MRSIKMPADIDTLEHVAYASFQYPENPEWGIQEDELENITAQFGTIRRLWFLFRAIALVYPRVLDLASGYVWEQDDQAVGLVLLQPTVITGGPSWLVGTVAVLPAYRRQGIARQLVQAGIELAKQKGAKTLMLDVFSQNTPAYKLYESLGFSHYTTMTQLSRESDTPLPAACSLPSDYRIVELPHSVWQPRYELVQRITPDEVKLFRPVEKSNYHPPFLIRTLFRLRDRFSGSVEKRYVVYRVSDDRIVATAMYNARTKAGGVNNIRAQLDPAYPDLALSLVGRLVREVMERSPGRRIGFLQPAWGQAVTKAALDIGFVRRNEWHDMGLVLA